MKPTFDETKRHILEAGQRLIAHKGFSGVGVSELLRAADIPKGSFYYYFDSKEQYGKALLEQYVSDYMILLEDILKADGRSPACARLMNYWRFWLDTQASQDEDEEKCLVVKLSAEVADLSDDMRIVLRDGTSRVIQRLAQCVEEGVADGSIPAHLPPYKTAEQLYHLWLGANLLTKLRLDGSALQAALSTTCELLQTA